MSELPEFLVHVNQIVSSDVGLLIVLIFPGDLLLEFPPEKVLMK